jgi:hypothetical protein
MAGYKQHSPNRKKRGNFKEEPYKEDSAQMDAATFTQ